MVVDDDIPLPRPDGIVDIDVDDDATPPTRKRGRPPGSRSTTPRRTRSYKTLIREQVRALVAIANTIIVASRYRDDALTEDEMTMLAEALEAEAMSHERIARWLGRMTGVSAHVLLIRACIVIAIPRLERRGIVPKIGDTIPTDTGGPDKVDNGHETYHDWRARFEATVPVETG